MYVCMHFMYILYVCRCVCAYGFRHVCMICMFVHMFYICKCPVCVMYVCVVFMCVRNVCLICYVCMRVLDVRMYFMFCV